MLTTRNEFETIPAFEVITGSSQGGYTSREIACDLIRSIETVTGLIDTTPFWREVAEYSDDSVTELDCIIDDCIEHLNYYAPIPASCLIGWRDNEVIVLPYLDDEIPRLEDCPDDHLEDVIYTVNDHGNVTCWQWNPSNVENNTTGGYESIWDMV